MKAVVIKGSWTGWNDFLGVSVNKNPVDYVKNMLDELRKKDARESKAYIEQCKRDAIVAIKIISKRYSLGKPLATSMAKKINDRIFNGEEIVIAIGPALGWTIDFKVQPTYTWEAKDYIS